MRFRTLCTVVCFLAASFFLPDSPIPLLASLPSTSLRTGVKGEETVKISPLPQGEGQGEGGVQKRRDSTHRGSTTGESCPVCHRLELRGIHAKLPCLSCHLDETRTLADPASASHRASGCTPCHKGFDRLFDRAMATREPERRFTARTWGTADPRFFEKTCNGCHIRGCGDCHGGSGHALRKPTDRDCLACHRGYFVGADYLGMAPREENRRYQRGPAPFGEPYLKMLPDVHAGRGMGCASCHSMKSLAAGEKASKTCRDCHRPDPKIIEHGIAAHLERLECAACHAAWAPQEYGTFFLRLVDSPSKEEYDLRTDDREWVKSVYLKKQDLPPLGLNRAGKVAPIRPEFIAYLSDIRNDRPVGRENRLLAASWKAYAPHTIQRGAPFCDACHDDPRRFLLERPQDRIYELRKDGMALGSFWDRTGQTVENGTFLPAERYRAMTARTPAYQKAYVKKWHQFSNRVDASSSP